MITYRNQCWNVLIKLLKELSTYPYFVENFEGKYANRIDGIYNRALKKCHMSSTDWKLLIETLRLVNEKDVTDEMREVFEEALTLDALCVTSAEGEDIYRAAKEKLLHRKEVETRDKALQQAKEEYEAAQLEREKFLAEQEHTLRILEEKELALEEARKKAAMLVENEKEAFKEPEVIKEETIKESDVESENGEKSTGSEEVTEESDE